MNYFEDIVFINIKKRREKCYDSKVITPNSYSIEFLKEGSLVFVVNEKKHYHLEAPCVFWMLPENSYQFLVANTEEVEHFWVDFLGNRAKMMMESIHERLPESSLKISRSIEFTTIFEEMIKVYQNYPSSRRYEAVVGLEQLAGIIYDSLLNIDRVKERKYEFIMELAKKIKRYPLKDYDLKKIAKKNGLSYHHFRKLFKDYNYLAPYDFLIASRMEYAAKILQQADIPIKELAASCGFDETSSFSRMFKRKMGLSPASYAKAAKSR